MTLEEFYKKSKKIKVGYEDQVGYRFFCNVDDRY